MARFEKRGKVFEITSSDARYTTELRKHLREGWTRVCDPRCEVPLGAEPVNPMLEDALRTDPDDAGAALVYADWLEQQGHPRGALIAVQHRLASSGSDAQLLEAEQRMFESSGDALLSRPLLANMAIVRGARERAEVMASRNVFAAGGQLVFDHGFIREASVLLHTRGGDEDLLWEVLRHPSARVLSRLSVRVQRPRDVALAIALLVYGPRPPLRALSLHALDTAGTVDLAGLDDAFPQLAELKLAVERVRFAELRLPALRKLDVRAKQHDLGRILAGATWPALAEIAAVGAPEQLVPAFERPVFPALQSLLLGDSEHALHVCRMVVRSPAAATLEALYLVDMQLPAEAVTMLAENRARFPRLETLDIVNLRADHRDRLHEAGYPLRSARAS